jgi:hypothetical protein
MQFSFRKFLQILAVGIIAGTAIAYAQAGPGASKSGSISAFGGYSYANPDYGPANTSGATIGVDLTRHVHIISPSLEARGSRTQGDSSTGIIERSLTFGLRLQSNGGRLHPYGDFLAGGGTIVYPPGSFLHEDRSTVYSYGGGVTCDLVHHVQAFADLQQQHWNLSDTHPAPFYPKIFTVGLTYVIPFRPFKRHGDPL